MIANNSKNPPTYVLIRPFYTLFHTIASSYSTRHRPSVLEMAGRLCYSLHVKSNQFMESRNQPMSAAQPCEQTRQGCGCTPRGCFFVLLCLYAFQCLLSGAALWHKYSHRSVDQVQLTLYYPPHVAISMFVPGLGMMDSLIHWFSGGRDLELVKALDVQLPDGRKYTLYSENFVSLDQLDIRHTPEGVQLTDEHGCNFVDTPAIPLTDFHN